jgi:hypothetical protein
MDRRSFLKRAAMFCGALVLPSLRSPSRQEQLEADALVTYKLRSPPRTEIVESWKVTLASPEQVWDLERVDHIKQIKSRAAHATIGVLGGKAFWAQNAATVAVINAEMAECCALLAAQYPDYIDKIQGLCYGTASAELAVSTRIDWAPHLNLEHTVFKLWLSAKDLQVLNDTIQPGDSVHFTMDPSRSDDVVATILAADDHKDI